ARPPGPARYRLPARAPLPCRRVGTAARHRPRNPSAHPPAVLRLRRGRSLLRPVRLRHYVGTRRPARPARQTPVLRLAAALAHLPGVLGLLAVRLAAAPASPRLGRSPAFRCPRLVPPAPPAGRRTVSPGLTPGRQPGHPAELDP